MKHVIPVANTAELVEQLGPYQVRESDLYRWLQDGDAIQSVMSITNPAELVLPNHRAMFAAFAFASDARKVLNLGFGLGAIERQLQLSYPALNLRSVETSQDVVALAKKYFEIAASYPVVIDAAERYLGSCKETFQIIFVDLFQSGLHASCLYAVAFYEYLLGTLSTDGVLSINLIPRGQQDLLDILIPLRQVFPNVLISKIANRSNVVVIASRTDVVHRPTDVQRITKLNTMFGFDFDAILGAYLPLPETQIR